jgi:hypothetical protein
MLDETENVIIMKILLNNDYYISTNKIEKFIDIIKKFMNNILKPQKRL